MINKQSIRTMIIILGIVLFPIHGAAQSPSPKSDWENVMYIPAGTRIEVDRKTGGKISGTLASVNTDLLSVKKGTTQIDVEAQQVKSIKLVRKDRAKTVAQGWAAGGVAMGGLLLIAAGSDREICPIEAFIGGAVFGGSIGALAGYFSSEKVLIYQAPKSITGK